MMAGKIFAALSRENQNLAVSGMVCFFAVKIVSYPQHQYRYFTFDSSLKQALTSNSNLTIIWREYTIKHKKLNSTPAKTRHCLISANVLQEISMYDDFRNIKSSYFISLAVQVSIVLLSPRICTVPIILLPSTRPL